MTRREFLYTSVMLPLLTSCRTISIAARPQPTIQELSVTLNLIKDDTTSRFIRNTHAQITSKSIISGDWYWLMTDQQVDELKRSRPEFARLDELDFYGITFMDTNSRPTYINLPAINQLIQKMGRNDKSEYYILRQVIAHEMERKLQKRVELSLPKRLRPKSDPYYAISIGATNGFSLITARGINSSDVANGTETLESSGGNTMPEFLTLDAMGAEAAADMTFGSEYFSDYLVGKRWLNLQKFLSLPTINLNTADFIAFHRDSDPFGLGKLIADRTGYQSPSPYYQIKTEHEASVGIILASYAASYGPSREFDSLQAELGLNLNYR